MYPGVTYTASPADSSTGVRTPVFIDCATRRALSHCPLAAAALDRIEKRSVAPSGNNCGAKARSSDCVKSTSTSGFPPLAETRAMDRPPVSANRMPSRIHDMLAGAKPTRQIVSAMPPPTAIRLIAES